MTRIWVKSYTKADGTKVPGHYRVIKGKKRSIVVEGKYLRRARSIERKHLPIAGRKFDSVMADNKMSENE